VKSVYSCVACVMLHGNQALKSKAAEINEQSQSLKMITTNEILMVKVPP